MITSETLRNTILAVGLSLLLMMAYVALKLSIYDTSLSTNTLLDEKQNIALNNSNANN